MRIASFADPTFTYDPDDPEGFRCGMFRPGPGLGAVATGTSLYELPSGQAVCPYHYEYGEEEWAMAIAGRPSVRTPEGTVEMRPFDIVFFPTGPEGAHQIRNDSDEVARVLMWSQIVTPSATAYPDSDKVGIWTGIKSENVLVRRSSVVDYYAGETA
jgi:uncharacterized cupin superfamily protein